MFKSPALPKRILTTSQLKDQVHQIIDEHPGSSTKKIGLQVNNSNHITLHVCS